MKIYALAKSTQGRITDLASPHRPNGMYVDHIDVLKSLNTKNGNYATLGENTSLAGVPLASLPKISISNLIAIAQSLHPQIFSGDVAVSIGASYEGASLRSRYSIAPSGRQKQVGTLYPDTSEEVREMGEGKTSTQGRTTDLASPVRSPTCEMLQRND